jgi:signal transduction histidine kinase
MRIADLTRTSRFRLTLIHGALFVGALVALLGLVYWQAEGYLTRQVDQILLVEARAMARADAPSLPDRISRAIQNDPRHVDLYGLFSSDGVWITGNIERMPRGLPIDGRPRPLSARDGFPTDSRALGERLPWGEILIVGRDVTQLAAFRSIIARALWWSGALVIVCVLAGAVVLSIQPLRRIRAVQEASAAITGGDLTVRLPTAGRGDELDMLAGIVNAMMDEIQLLIADARSVGDSIAHDLRTPLTRLRLILHRVREESALTDGHRAALDDALAEADALLGRFAAVLRISEIESRKRRAGFASVDLGGILEQVRSMYEPVAEEAGVSLIVAAGAGANVGADADLLVEALGNLVDNAIKFTPAGGRVLLRLARSGEGVSIEVIDNGPGIDAEERGLVLQRFYRGRGGRQAPGSGLGLSIVAAIARLHGFTLTLADAAPGLRVSLSCWSDRSG